MRKTMFWGLAFFFVCGLTTGCGGAKGTPDEAAANYNEAADILKDVKDKKTAEEAKPKLVKVGEKMKASMEAAAKKNPAATSPFGATYPEAEQKKITEAAERFMKEQTRIMKELPTEGADLFKAFAEAAGQKTGPGSK